MLPFHQVPQAAKDRRSSPFSSFSGTYIDPHSQIPDNSDIQAPSLVKATPSSLSTLSLSLSSVAETILTLRSIDWEPRPIPGGLGTERVIPTVIEPQNVDPTWEACRSESYLSDSDLVDISASGVPGIRHRQAQQKQNQHYKQAQSAPTRIDFAIAKDKVAKERFSKVNLFTIWKRLPLFIRHIYRGIHPSCWLRKNSSVGQHLPYDKTN